MRERQRTSREPAPSVNLQRLANGVHVDPADLDRALYALGEGPDSLGHTLADGDPDGTVPRLAKLLDRSPRALALSLCDALEAPDPGTGSSSGEPSGLDPELGPVLSAGAAWLGSQGAHRVSQRARRARRWVRSLSAATVLGGVGAAAVGLLGLTAPDPMAPLVWTTLTLAMTVVGVAAATLAVLASGFLASAMDRVEQAASVAGSEPARVALQVLLQDGGASDAGDLVRRVLPSDG